MYEQGLYDMLIRARSLVNSFHVTLRVPPEVLGIISSYLTEEDLFSASQVCQYWRSALVSSPSLWTQFSCHGVPRTIVSLGRCGSLPIQLRIGLRVSEVALEDILLHENKIVSLTVDHPPNKVPRLHPLLVSSRPYLERLHINTQDFWDRTFRERAMDEVWQGLPSLRDLFVSRYSFPIDQLASPNLTHLALHHTGYEQNVTAQTILDMLRKCPLLETLLLNYSDAFPPITARGHPPVYLPHLRSIEMGVQEVRSGLITHLNFPKDITAGFRIMQLSELWDNIPSAMQLALENTDVCRVALTLAPNFQNSGLLVHFEGSQDSLDINVGDINPLNLPTLFGPQGTLFSHKFRIRDAKELHIINQSTDDIPEPRLFSLAMSNVVSISFYFCSGPQMSELLAPSHPPSLPFPHLERIMVLGSESELEYITRRRRGLGARLKTLVIGQAPEGFEYVHLEDYTVLEGLVDDLWVECPTQLLQWGTRNKIADIWSTALASGEVSSRGTLVAWT